MDWDLSSYFKEFNGPEYRTFKLDLLGELQNLDSKLKFEAGILKKSGAMSCEQMVRETLGEDVQDPAFWKRAIESLNEPFTKLQALLN